MPPKRNLKISETDKFRLIDFVEKFLCIFDKSDRSHHDKTAVRNAWTRIAEELHLTESDAKLGWTNLRDQYVRHLKSLDLPSGSSAEIHRKFPFFTRMNFVKQQLCKRKTTGNVDDDDYLQQNASETQVFTEIDAYDLNCEPHVFEVVIPENINSFEPSSPIAVSYNPTRETGEVGVNSEPPVKKIKKAEKDVLDKRLVDYVTRNESSQELYANSLVATFHRLSERQFAEAKIKIQEVLLNVEFPPESNE